MKISMLAILFIGFFVAPRVGQSPRKIANINKEVVGKWWSGDRKSFIEILPNGVCREGALYPDGEWHVHNSRLGVLQGGNHFYCIRGALTLIGANVLIRDYGMGVGSERYYRGLRNIPKKPATLSLATARRILNQQINVETTNNTLFTCHACHSPNDKQDNGKAPVVSKYSAALLHFLMTQGYVRSCATQQYFTAKAKRSKYYGGDWPVFGLRFANFKNPRILTNRIVNLKHVPIEYHFVPTELTIKFFGRVREVKAFASFYYESGTWRVSIVRSLPVQPVAH